MVAYLVQASVGSFTRRGTHDSSCLVSRARCRFMGLVIVTCFPKKKREDATHRLAFEYLHECFAASQGGSSRRIREAICLSLNGRSSIGFDIEKSSSPSIQIPAVRKSSPSVCRARSCRRCVQARYTSRFVASKCSQRVDVHLLLGGPSCPSPSRRARELS